MKTGDIVRLKLKTGALVGVFKVVDDVCKTGVYAHNIPNDALGSMFYKKEQLEVVSSVVLQSPNQALKDVIDYRLNYIEHITNKEWAGAWVDQKMLRPEDRAKAIIIKSTTSHIIVSEPSIRRVNYMGKESIRVSFVRVLEYVIR